MIYCIRPFLLGCKQAVKELIAHKFGALSGVNSNELNKLESKVYEAIKINQNLTAKEISENLYIPFRSVQRYLATLKEKGFIVREGSNKKVIGK